MNEGEQLISDREIRHAARLVITQDNLEAAIVLAHSDRERVKKLLTGTAFPFEHKNISSIPLFISDVTDSDGRYIANTERPRCAGRTEKFTEDQMLALEIMKKSLPLGKGHEDLINQVASQAAKD